MFRDSYYDSQSNFVVEALDHGIPSDHFSRFVVRFVDTFSFFIEEDIEKNKKGRKGYDDLEMMKLIFYAFSEGVTSPRMIVEFAKYHQIYQYVSNRIEPSESTIRRFLREKGYLFNKLLGCTLIFAREVCMTDFEHCAIDGTYKKAHNSKYNVIHKKDAETLLKYYQGVYISEEEISKLKRPALKLLKRTDLNDEEKLDLLYDVKTAFTIGEQNTVPLNDVEARWMHNKSGNNEISYNIQSAVDTKSKLICALNITQSPTDHYEIPDIVNKLIGNLGQKPEKISADTIYHNIISFQYFNRKNIDGIIVDRKQTKTNKGKLNKNPYHKDHFTYNEKTDEFTCPENQKLTYHYEYTTYKKGIPTIKRIYQNYNACKNCKVRNKCTTRTHRQITETGGKLALQMKTKMKKDEYKEEYKKRSSTVEAPFGTLKTFYNINQIPSIGKHHTLEILEAFSTTYNLKIIYNKQHQIYDETTNTKTFIQQMEHQLNLCLKTKTTK